MSLQVHDPRSRTRSRSRERSRSRDSRVPSPSPSRSRPRSRSPAVELPKTSSRDYGTDEEAEIERQYKLLSERKLRDLEEPRNVISRAPRSPARYDLNRSDSDADKSRRRRDRRDDRYEHSGSEDERIAARAREYSSQPRRRRPSSPPGHSSRLDDSDSDSLDDALAYGDALGSHPSYARPDRFRYAQPANFLHAQPGAPRQSGYADPQSDWAPIPECERPGFVPPSSQAGETSAMPGAFPPASTYANASGTAAPSFPAPQYANLSSQQFPYASSSAGAYVPSHSRNASASDAAYPPTSQYASVPQYQYAQVDPKVRYSSKAPPKQSYTASPQEQFGKPADQSVQPVQPMQSYRYSSEPQFVEITPGGGRGRPHSLSVSTNNLAVTGTPTGPAPASPLLEPYHGTYQSISPMPSPIAMSSSRDEDISDLEPLDGGTSNSESGRRNKHRSKSGTDESRYRSSKDKSKEKDRGRDERKEDKRRSRLSTSHVRQDSNSSVPGSDALVLISPTSGRKRVSFYDAGADAAAMQSALNHTRNIDTKPIIHILPRLSSDEIPLLRQEYKKRVRTHGKGINLAKHLRLKLGTSSFGKVCYATALGRWESEAYWANCYYQAGTSRRELLIESLIGRSNTAIREIKACFRDPRYGDSLERCMRSELRADKFRTAILLALEAGRQDEREPLDSRLIRQDVRDLHRALVSRDGGETAMIHIIVLRSDEHLREVLRAYEASYGHNFARAMIAKSRNLVGETLAHILNGAINRPMRDALLLHQALRESRTGRERSELLISRLVRLHWEPRHLEQVKLEYRRRYDELLEEAIAEEVMSSSGGSEWGEFCIELARSSRDMGR
ncbi:Annexin [Penicillium alfredii]|uniref:Annexin n=1 Tax=Penicillium alfredii TaxID=1506179 RepID=A0A9W9KQS2_9EURO|nr:Annexin [Penicillium alfredii]KAJ5114780.1 Annexin [Penicillium alfredii]